jgi:hypothetical protein
MDTSITKDLHAALAGAVLLRDDYVSTEDGEARAIILETINALNRLLTELGVANPEGMPRIVGRELSWE